MAIAVSIAIAGQLGYVRAVRQSHDREYKLGRAIDKLSAQLGEVRDQLDRVRVQLDSSERENATLLAGLQAATGQAILLEESARALGAHALELSELLREERPPVDFLVIATEQPEGILAEAENLGSDPIQIVAARAELELDGGSERLEIEEAIGPDDPLELATGNRSEVFAIGLGPARAGRGGRAVRGVACVGFQRTIPETAPVWVEVQWFRFEPAGALALVGSESWALDPGETVCDRDAIAWPVSAGRAGPPADFRTAP